MKLEKLSLLVAGLMAIVPVCTLAQDKDMRYVDAAKLTIINKTQKDNVPLQRLDVRKYSDLSQTVARYYSFSTGVAVVFRTDSKNISATWSTNTAVAPRANSPLIASHGLDMYIFVPDDDDAEVSKKSEPDYSAGKWVWAGVGVPSNGKTDHENKIVSNMDGKMHVCVLYLPLFAQLTSLRIGVDKGSTIEGVANPFKHKIVVMGSSLTNGAGVSRPGMAYPARLERHFGFQFTNLGVSGQCKLDEFFAHVIAETEADAFIFDAFSNPGGKTIRERLGTFVKIIREAHPNTPLIFLQDEVREEGNFNVDEYKGGVRKREIAAEEMAKVMEQYGDIYFIDPAMVIGDDHEATIDGIHITDLGYERMLKELEPKLKEIFDKYGIN